MGKATVQWWKIALAAAALFTASACSNAIDETQTSGEGQSEEAAQTEGKSDSASSGDETAAHQAMPEPQDVVIANHDEVRAHAQTHTVEPVNVVIFEDMVAMTFSRDEGVAMTVLAHKDSQEPVGSLLVGALETPTYKFIGGSDQQLPAASVPADYQGQAELLYELWQEHRSQPEHAPDTDLGLDDPDHAHPSEPTQPSEPNQGEYETREQGLSQGAATNFCFHSGYRYSTHNYGNGCSWSPDGWWGECCDMHDKSYYDGGNSWYDRYLSDYYLIDHCIDRQGGPGNTYFDAVQSFGSGAFNWWNGSCSVVGDKGNAVNGIGRYHNIYWYSLDNYDQLRMCGYYY